MAEQAAEEFIKNYYDCIDGNRQALADAYGSGSVLRFNSDTFEGLDEVGKKIMDLPEMKHTVKSFDAVPLGDTILVHTAGSVELEPGKPIIFSQSFVLAQKPGGGCFIAAQIFQLHDN